MVHIIAPRDYLDQPALVTPWSLVHFAFGMLSHSLAVYAGNILFGFVCFFLAHLMYEVKDMFFAYVKEEEDQQHAHTRKVNSFLNCVGDQLLACFGFLFAMIVFGKSNTVWKGLLSMASAFLILVLILAVNKDPKLFNIWYGLG